MIKRFSYKRLYGLIFALMVTLFFLEQSVYAVSDGRYAHPEALIQPEELKHMIDNKWSNIQIIDVRPNLKYFTGHIPGAVQVWRPDIEDKNHYLPGMMASRGQIENLMGNLGISNEDTLIIYSDQYDHARLWWVLAYYGISINQMKLLDGGIEGWKAKGFPTELKPTQVQKSGFVFPKNGTAFSSLLCGLPEVKSVSNNPKKVVLDVRSKKEYLGEEIKEGAQRAGRIPGVAWIEWKEALIEEGPHQGYWKQSEEIRKIFLTKRITPDKDIYIYCQSGVRSAHSLVSLYLAGYPLNKLHNFDGSWIEWSRTQEPIEAGLPAGQSDHDKSAFNKEGHPR